MAADELIAEGTEAGVVVDAAVLAEMERRAEAERAARLAALGQRLQEEIDRRRGQRREIEARWLKDMRQYNNQYEPTFKSELDARTYGSRVFVPLTRRVCNIIEARLGDLLFPTDERGYAINASPVPELSEAQADADRLPPDRALPAGPNGEPVRARDVSLAIRELREEAGKRAAAMQRQVDDRLKEADWPSVARRAMHQAIILGTGVVKGPFVYGRTRKRWQSTAPGVTQLVVEQDLTPTAVFVDTWDFFPDMTAPTLASSESEYERHWLNKAEFAKLATQPGFDGEAIRKVLRDEPSAVRDFNRDSLREAAGTQGISERRWCVWEYSGPLDAEDLEACGCILPDEDPLLAYEAVVWFADGGTVLKAVINPMDTDERPYSAFNWQQDDASIFGFGLPYELRDLQQAGNSTFRANMDNGGLSVGPQIVINRKKLRPINGRWEIEPLKLWETTDRTDDVRSAFAFFEISSRAAELLNLFAAIKALVDEIGGPMLAMQGQDAPSLMKTDLGKSIAYSAANVWMKRAVKNFDDQITTPLINRFVAWEMQYNPDANIKGDMNVIARGTSALIEAEGQVQRTMQLLEAAKDIPMPIKRRINMLRAMAKAMRLDDSDILPDDDELREMEQAEKEAAKQGPPPNPEIERIKMRQTELEDNQAERQHTLQIEDMRTRIRLAEIASREGLTIEQARLRYGIEELKMASELEDKAQQRAHDAQKFNAELVTKQRMGTGI